MAHSMPEETEALLNRLSQKPGVQSTLVLSRTTGAIVRASGLVMSAPSIDSTSSTLPSTSSRLPSDLDAPSRANGSSGLKNAEALASMVYTFVNTAGGLVKGLDGEDEVKLLRLRTRRNELVIVPDTRFLLVVVHDTPAA